MAFALRERPAAQGACPGRIVPRDRPAGQSVDGHRVTQLGVVACLSPPRYLLACVLVPRGFCGYLCPLGTLIDLFDWIVGRRVIRFRAPADGWWVHLKYYLLLGTLVAAVGGVLVSGFVAAIPIVTRGFLFLMDPLQTGVARDWHLVPPWIPATSSVAPVRRAGTWIPAAAILVQVRLSERRGLLVGQSDSSDRTQGRGLVHPLQQVRRDLSVRRDQARFHDAHDRLHLVPNVRRGVSDGGDQVRRALESCAAEGA